MVVDKNGYSLLIRKIIVIQKSSRGEIKIFFAIGLVETMVQNMLSLHQKDVTEKMMEDCAKEAVNMIGGSFLHKLDSSKAFDLSLPMFTRNHGIFVPQVKNQSETAWNLSFESEGNFMAVSVNTYSGGM